MTPRMTLDVGACPAPGCTIRARMRRVVLSAMSLASLGLGGCRAEAAARDGADGDPAGLRVAFIAPDGDAGASARRGASLGAEEAAHTGALLGRSFEMRAAVADGRDASVDAAKRLLDAGAHVIVGGFDDATCEALAGLAAERGVLMVNVGCRADALRRAGAPHLFHVEASDSMYLGALAAARASGGAAPVLWHAGLARYGAAQLNQRFLRQEGRPADARAWASWMAMKVLWQASSAGGAVDAERLAAELVGSDDGFDGHKGEPLRFDPVTRQLRQPLFPPPVAGPAVAREEGAPTDRAPASDAARLRRAADAGDRLLVITNEGSADVQVLSEAGALLATIPFAERPRGIQLADGGRRVLVALSDELPTEAGDGDAIAEIDLREGRVTRRHAAGSDPEQFAVSADGRLLVAANEDAGTATLVDRVRGTPLATLIVGIEPEGVALSPDGRWAYLTAETSNTVSVIDTRRREVIASFLVDERPRAAAFSPDGRMAYVSNEISGTLSVIDVARHAVVASLALDGGRARPVGIVVSPDSRTVYVANGRANTVSVVDADTRRETAVIAVGRRPWGLAMSRDGRWLYTANGGSDDVSVIAARARRVTRTIRVGARPWGVVVTR